MAKADFYLYIKAKPAANTELLCFFLTLKLYGRKSNLLLGASGKNTIVLKQNSNSSGLKFIDGGTITQAEAQSADQAAQIVFDNKIPVSEGIIVFVNFIFAFRYSMIVQKYGRGDYGAYILFGCNVPTLTYHTKTAGTWN